MLPDLSLSATDGSSVVLSSLKGRTVIYAYPRTSPPNAAPIEGWDDIPGARGCTPQSCGFRDHFEALRAVGVDQVFGLSAQDTDYQREVVGRLHLPFALLSDAEARLRDALHLPSFEAGGMVLLQRFTLILNDAVVETVLYPVQDPAGQAAEIERLLGAG